MKPANESLVFNSPTRYDSKRKRMDNNWVVHLSLVVKKKENRKLQAFPVG